MKTKNLTIVKFKKNNLLATKDKVVVEKPLEIWVNNKKAFICLRLPGKDLELALGLCFSEKIITRYEDLKNIKLEKNKIFLSLKNIKNFPFSSTRIIKSSAGLPNFNNLTSPLLNQKKEKKFSNQISVQKIFTLKENFFSKQKTFNLTGGTHAAAIYDLKGKNLSFAEDVGRHNALDKCSGEIIKKNKFEKVFLVMLSSRLSYEMIYKASLLKAEIVLGVSAPTSLAIKTAKAYGLTLIGFLREGRFNIYSFPERIISQ